MIRVGDRLVVAGKHKLKRNDISWGLATSLMSKFEDEETILNLILNINNNEEVLDILELYVNTTDKFDFLLYLAFGDEFEFEMDDITTDEYKALIVFILKVVASEMEPLLSKESEGDDEEITLSESFFAVDSSISEAANTSMYDIRNQFMGSIIGDIISFNKKAEKENKENNSNSTTTTTTTRKGTEAEFDALFR